MKFYPSKLSGTITIPPSKSYAHRAIIAASLAHEESQITNVDLSDDIRATINGMEVLGASIKKNFKIKGYAHIRKNKINCIESGTTLRFLIPLSLLENKQIKFVGERSLLERPLLPYFKIFRENDISYDRDTLPITIKGLLKPGEYDIDGEISSQFISGLLFALPLLDGNSVLRAHNLVSRGYVNLTINILRQFGVEIRRKEDVFYIKGNQEYKACKYEVEGDYSQAAFYLAANELGSNVEVKGLKKKSLQPDSAFRELVKKNVIDISDVPDLGPILTTVLALRNGQSKIINAKRLAYKESNRLLSITSELNKIGAHIVAKEDEIIIDGVNEFQGGTVTSWGDHRIAMCLAIASTRCNKPLEIDGIEAISKSYPNFINDFISLGGKIDE